MAAIASKARCIKSYWNKSSFGHPTLHIMDVKTSPGTWCEQMNIPQNPPTSSSSSGFQSSKQIFDGDAHCD